MTAINLLHTAAQQSSTPQSSEPAPGIICDHGDGIFSLHIDAASQGSVLSPALVVALLTAFDELQQTDTLKVLILKSRTDVFLRGGRDDYNHALAQQFFTRVIHFPYPIIAALQGDATGAGFLTGALCDFMITAETAHYGYSSAQDQLFPSAAEIALFTERFGAVLAQAFLFGEPTAVSGTQLHTKGWTCPVVPHSEVDACAHKLAMQLAKKPQMVLRVLKNHLSRRLTVLTNDLVPVAPWFDVTEKEKIKENIKENAKENAKDIATENVNINKKARVIDKSIAPVLLTSPSASIQLSVPVDQVLVITLARTKKKVTLKTLLTNLTQVFDQLRDRVTPTSSISSAHNQYKSVVLVSEYPNFFPESDTTISEDFLTGFQSTLKNCVVPVAVVLQGDASAKAWLASLSGDATVYSHAGRYSAGNMLQDAPFAAIALMEFSTAFGAIAGRELLMSGATYSGDELQQRLPHIMVAQPEQLITLAINLATFWAQFPLDVLLTWKNQRGMQWQESRACVKNNFTETLHLTQALQQPESPSSATPEKPKSIPLASSVVSATAYPEGIVHIVMEDRDAKNMFSQALVQGMNDIFEHIDQSPFYRAVVITGYDNYFAAGGTRESLEAIHAGTLKFTDHKIYQLAFDCKLPVIAAMQGHGIGGGLSLGLFADFIVLSEESKYLSPYMGYGFTPGAGATLLVPERFGKDLGRETLFTAQEYSGSELQARGVGLQVVPRKHIQDAALALAHHIARHERAQLIALKQQWNANIRDYLMDNERAEVAMHEQTFVGQQNTLVQIQQSFTPVATVTSTENTEDTDNKIYTDTFAEVISSIKKLLGQELQLEDDEISEDTPFVDLGLDSITGVTWIRKINEKYNTAIEAATVYSYPTLTKLGRFVQEEIAELNAVQVKGAVQPKNAVQLASVSNIPSLPCVQSEDNLFTNSDSIEYTDNLLNVTAHLKKLLAQELHLEEKEIDENIPFVDLGLDSITGVTWIRKINEKYKTAIEAATVYSYPTLTKLSCFVKDEAEQQSALTELSSNTKVVFEPIEHAAQVNLISIKPLKYNAQQDKTNTKSSADTDHIGAESGPAIKKLVSLRVKDAEKINFTSTENFPKNTSTIPPSCEIDSTQTNQSNISGSTAVEKNSTSSQSNQLHASQVNRNETSQVIAIVGMAGQFPKAKNLDEFWKNIAQGKNCISEIPANRWDLHTHFQEGEPTEGKTNSKWMGLLEEYDLFDPLFFNISPAEAQAMDPQQRVFLQACWHTIENAGYNPRSLSGTQCGVFVGCANGDYSQLSQQTLLSAYGFTGGASAILAARISYLLDLQGPCLSIDTACSSSLVAIATACDSLVSGASDSALAGGVYIGAGPSMHIMTAQAGMLSTDGQCFSFDQRANGFVPGEAVGVVMLKRLADAERDGDIIHATIEGWGINQDGKTNGITAPNLESQARLEQAVYERFNIDPANIQLIEAHGTGTKLGDPIEVSGLKKAFKKYTQKKSYCALSSVKSNIGHCLLAAGVSGVIKVALSLKHKQLPPIANFNELNEHIALNDSPFYINNQLKDWVIDVEQKRQAAISSFGFSGTNAHLVMGEYIVQDRLTTPIEVIAQNGKIIVPLSAKTREQLFETARELLRFIQGQPTSNLFEIAYTLQVGREAMDERVGFLVQSLEHLIEKLTAFTSVKGDIPDIHYAQVRANKEGMSLLSQDEDLSESLIAKCINQKNLAKLVKFWTKGLEFDWNRLYGEVKPNRICLPGYPFAKERYWIDEVDNKETSSGQKIHYLLHQNTSNFNQQSYSSIFSGNEPFFERDPESNKKYLSTFALLEMVRTAVTDASPHEMEKTWVEFTNVAWLTGVEPDKKISVALFAIEENVIDFEIFSNDSDEVIQHCCGKVLLRQKSELPRHDLAQVKSAIKTDDKQALLTLASEDITEINVKDCLIPPKLITYVLQEYAKASSNFSSPHKAVSLKHARIFAPLRNDMFAWVHQTQTAPDCMTIDVDIVDPQGNICIQLVGLGLQKSLEIEVAKSAILENTEQLLFEEYWHEYERVDHSVSTLDDFPVVLFTNTDLYKSIQKIGLPAKLKDSWLVRASENLTQLEGKIFETSNRPEHIKKLITQISEAANKPLSIIYTWAKGQGEAGVHNLFDFFKAIKDVSHLISKVILIGHYNPNDLNSCWDYSWIGFERSLKLQLPDVEISLFYTTSSATDVKDLTQVIHEKGITWLANNKNFHLATKSLELTEQANEPVIRQKGRYLITGGCGALGLAFAGYLAENYNADLYLIGRSALSNNVQGKLDKLKSRGAGEVHYYSLDICNKESLVAWAKSLNVKFSGVIHAAGIESGETFLHKTFEDITQVLAPKTIGTLNMDECLEQQLDTKHLDFVCYFSSSAAILGDFGSCDYAIANRFQMAYGIFREQLKMPGKTFVINWPLWEKEVGQINGMGLTTAEQTSFYLKTSGQKILDKKTGIKTWHKILQSNYSQTLLMIGKPTRINQLLQRAYATDLNVEPIIRDALLPHTHVQKNNPAIQTDDRQLLRNNILESSILESSSKKSLQQDASLKEAVQADLKRLISSSLNLPVNRLDEKTNLADYGFDSINLASFAKKLGAHFSIEITPTLFFNHSSIYQLSNYFVEEYQEKLQQLYAVPTSHPENYSDEESRKVINQLIEKNNTLSLVSSSRSRFIRNHKSPSKAQAATSFHDPIAIIGISGRFPSANNVDEFWHMLAEEKSGVTEVPPSRWNWRDYFNSTGDINNKINTNKGGFIDGIDEFDPLFFEISPVEAEEMDPAERIFLMEAYRAIEDARISPASLRGSNTGVFVGMEEGQYASLTGAQGVTTTGNAMISSRLSYFLDLHGPTISTNTACSSGLVALHQAVASLQQGECESALVAGIALNLAPEAMIKMSEAGMISPDGECFSFSKHANGIGIGEAVVVVILKPLSVAIKNGEHIYGTIKASGINFDGKTNGVTAPSGKMQAKLIEKIYLDNHINCQDISHIVAHGTGTRLGDPVEINALNEAFKKLNKIQNASEKPEKHCAITSCKTNFGHTLAASGLVSLVGLLKAIQNKKIPANLYCEEESDYNDWKKSYFYINKKTQDWKRQSGKPLMGAVSAFGRSGTNVHLVIEEYIYPENTQSTTLISPTKTKVIIPLSARNSQQLHQKARDLFDFIIDSEHLQSESSKLSQPTYKTIDLQSMSYTLQSGREAMEERLAFIVSSVEQLAEKLRAYISGEQHIEDSFIDTVNWKNGGMSVISQDDDMQEAIAKWIASNKLSKIAQLWVKGLELNWQLIYGDIKPARIHLPTYPFAKDRYWIDRNPVQQQPAQYLSHQKNPHNNFDSIEAIINQIDSGSIEAHQAVELIKQAV